ncbi:MAG: ADP-ribosylglycohydrolase family protein [bacterium]|nr:ADP-ribosylglycohydrolase family protein [bacterium]
MNREPETHYHPGTRYIPTKMPADIYLNGGEFDRAAGAVVGSAVGDALGAFYEPSYPGLDEEIVMRAGGDFDHRRALGGWTDDTSMALGVLDAMAAGYAEAESRMEEIWGPREPGRPENRWYPPAISVNDMAANFLAWYRGHPPDVGNQTAQVLSRADGPEDVAQEARRFTEGNPNSAGNGALMRTAPVGLTHYFPGRVASLAAEVAALTHPHPDSSDACVLWSVAVQQAIFNRYDHRADRERYGDREGPIDFTTAVRGALGHLPDEARQRRWEQLIDEVTDTPNIAEARQRFTPNGWVVTAFQAALWAIVSTPEHSPEQHFRDALVTAVRIGHDTDTVAAIAGGLLGARWGLAAIPEEWTRDLHGDRVRGETVSGIELATLAMQAFECTMRRFFAQRAARCSGF